jgi:hypothetical protein
VSASRARLVDLVLVSALFIASTIVSFDAMRTYRAAGFRPWFYQGNFEPAVMMACGRGFHTTTFQAIPASLRAFLDLASNSFSCAALEPDLPLVRVTWNGTWYYLYGTTALVWKATGISWTALDGLVAVMGGVTTVALYGLFRIVSGPWIAAPLTLLMTLSPSNLTNLLSLRDYSKAPFVLAATFVLALLIIRPFSRALTVALAGVFGAVVGLGYGFRGDLMVMAPFGVVIIALFLPGDWRTRFRRNLLAAAVAAVVFLIVAAPALRGLGTGGCQFHYSLLGLTAPLAREMAVTPALYSFGDHFTDTFVDLKVGDYANRVLGARAPNLCSPDYDTASGQLFRRFAVTFPADLAVHAYGALLIITRAGVEIPDTPYPPPAGLDFRIARVAHRWLTTLTRHVSPLGPLVTGLAIAVAWSMSVRLGLALTAFVLFLGGYPAIEFESRHWFHLQFIPWWAAVFVSAAVVRHGLYGWRRDEATRAAIGLSATLAALVTALLLLRAVQTQTASAIFRQYIAASTEPLAVSRHESVVDVDWRPLDYGSPPEHRSSDMLVITLARDRCGSRDPLPVRIRYEADGAHHDLTTTVSLERPFESGDSTRLFVPVFSNGFQNHSYLCFTSLEVLGVPADCITGVARVVDRAVLPLWTQAHLPADWTNRLLYQTLRRPRILR